VNVAAQSRFYQVIAKMIEYCRLNIEGIIPDYKELPPNVASFKQME
jgi:hypothetical protein